MKRINTANGSSIVAYEYDDLSQEAKDKVIEDFIAMEAETMNEDSPYWYLAERMDDNQTPWFLVCEIYDNHLTDIEETIRMNEYLFDEDGDMFHVCRHYVGNKQTKTTYKGKECTLINI